MGPRETSARGCPSGDCSGRRCRMRSRWMPVLTLLIAVVATAAIWLVARSGRVFGPLPAIEPTRSPLLAKDGNVFLYVGSMAFEPRVVDICVKIDGKPAVHDSFEHDLTSELTRYRLRLARLPPGQRRQRARAGQPRADHRGIGRIACGRRVLLRSGIGFHSGKSALLHTPCGTDGLDPKLGMERPALAAGRRRTVSATEIPSNRLTAPLPLSAQKISPFCRLSDEISGPCTSPS